jgi:hypothetical protein
VHGDWTILCERVIVPRESGVKRTVFVRGGKVGLWEPMVEVKLDWRDFSGINCAKYSCVLR